MKSRTWILLGAVIVIGGIAAALMSRSKPIAVDVAAVDRGVVAETVTNTRAGTVKACERARLAPATGGQIARLAVKKGDRVKPGQVLLELWNEDVKAQVTLSERDAVASKAREQQACITADVARRQADRTSALLEQRLVAADVVDRVKGEADAAAAACTAAKENTSVSHARVDAARAALERTLLRAPFEGTVAEINGELGEFITPSPVGIPTPPAVDVVDTRCIYVTAPIDEVDAPRIREGMQARVTLDAFKNRNFPAHIRRVAPYVLDTEKQARTVEIEAEIEEPSKEELLPGYSADVEVILDEQRDVLRIPTRALLERKQVYVLDPQRKRVELRNVEIGLGNWEYTQVKSGVKEGERVVTSVDREGLKDGAEAEAGAATAAANAQ